MHIRRVATGQDGAGKSRFVSDQAVPIEGVEDVFEIALLWSDDALPTFPSSGQPSACPSYFPPSGGYRFTVVNLPPQDVAREAQARLAPADVGAAFAAVEDRVGAGLLAAIETDHPGMHTTDTIDFGVILKGEIWLELDDGEEVHLKTGDTFVQNGTRHRWNNRGTQTATMLVVLIGGPPRAGRRA